MVFLPKIKCTVSYDGTNYAGYQVQPNGVTIQEVIEVALAKMHKGQAVRIHSSGRTDRGVHAIGQVFHFETELVIAPDAWKRAINALLPDDVLIRYVEIVDDGFHARIDAMTKEYRYFVRQAEEVDVFKRNYVYTEKDALDFVRMQEACGWFVGTYDFTAFSSARSTVKGSKVRTLFDVRCEREDDMYVFILRGNGFLYNMVRIIVGVLIEAGKGHVSREDVEQMFASKDRQTVGKTLPPEGLYLWEVTYGEAVE